jgi:hypothetical protein
MNGDQDWRIVLGFVDRHKKGDLNDFALKSPFLGGFMSD